MIRFTPNEKKALLTLFKGILHYYNANSLSKVLGISRVGTMKMLRKFLKEGVLQSETIGKSIVYKLRLHDDYVRKLIAFLLADEAQMQRRWKMEFEGLFKEGRVIIVFGSVLRNSKEARDIDLMVIVKEDNKKEWDEIKSVIRYREGVLPKRVHWLPFVEKGFISDVAKRNKAMIDIIKNSVVLYGQERYVEMIYHVTGIQTG